MSIGPPDPGTPPLPEPGSLRCPRCSATVGPHQDWCLECGAPARTRLAQTPNWQLPTVAIGAIILVAGAMLAFAFVRLTDDGSAPASTTPTAITTVAPIVPSVPTGPPVAVPPATTPTTPLTTPTTAVPAPTATVTTPATTVTTPAATPSRPQTTAPSTTTTTTP